MCIRDRGRTLRHPRWRDERGDERWRLRRERRGDSHRIFELRRGRGGGVLHVVFDHWRRCGRLRPPGQLRRVHGLLARQRMLCRCSGVCRVARLCRSGRLRGHVPRLSLHRAVLHDLSRGRRPVRHHDRVRVLRRVRCRLQLAQSMVLRLTGWRDELRHVETHDGGPLDRDSPREDLSRVEDTRQVHTVVRTLPDGATEQIQAELPVER